MLPRIPSFAFLVFSLLATGASADTPIEGGPGYARALNNVFFADDFSQTLDQRYIAFNTGFASSYVEDGVLVSLAGPYQSIERPSSRVIFNRVLFPNDSFRISVQIGVSAGSAGHFVHGLGIFDPINGSVFPLLSLIQSPHLVGNDPETDEPIYGLVRSVGKSADDPNLHAFEFIDGQLYDAQLEYDAPSQTISVSVPAAEYTAVVPAQYPHGFMVGIFTLAADRLNSKAVGLTDNITSNITFDTYTVSNTPLAFEGELYDDTLPAFFPGGSDGMVYFLDPAGHWPLLPVSADGTYLNLDGIRDLNAYLISRGTSRATVYSPLQPTAFAAMVAGLVIIRTYKLGILKAHGAGVDYSWHLKALPPSVVSSCGTNCGSGGCNVPAAGVGGSTTINLANGNLFHSTNVIASGPKDSGPQVYYNAKNGASIMGRGWSHAEMTSIRTESNGDFTVLTSTGGELRFRPIAFAPQGYLEYTPINGCCVGNFFKARQTEFAFDVIERGGVTWHYPLNGGSVFAKTDLNGLTWSYSYEDGRLSDTADPYGRTYRFAYTTDGLLDSITDPAGTVTAFEYENGQLIRAVDPRGYAEHYEYNTNGVLSRLTDKASFSWSFSYDSQGRVVEISDDNGDTTTVTYIIDGAIVTDRRGYPTVYGFDPSKNVILTITDPLNRVTTQTFDDYSNLVLREDPAGYVTATEYDGFHNPVRVIDAEGGIRTTAYNQWGQPVLEVDPNGNTTEMVYDSRANLIEITDPLGHTTTTIYDTEGNKASDTNREGYTSYYVYQDGVLTQLTNGAGEVLTYSRDALGRTVSITDGAGFTTNFILDELGNEVYRVYPDGFSIQTIVDGMGRPVAYPSPYGTQNVASIQYDEYGNVLSSKTYLGRQSTHEFDPEGNEILERSPAGRERLLSFDPAGQNTLLIDGDGPQQITGFDERGNFVEIHDSNSALTLFSYDSMNRLSKILIDGAQTEYFHDLNGNVIHEIRNGRVYRFSYDKLNRKVTVAEPLGTTTQTFYDAEGRISKKTDPAGRVVSFEYDGVGRRSNQVNPDGGEVRWLYDERGNLETKIDPLGHLTRYVHDSRGRRVAEIDPLGGVWRSEYSETSQIVAEENPLGERTEYTYDEDDRLLSKTDPLGRTTDYEYDLDGNLVSEILPGASPNERVNRTKVYDAKNQVVAIREDSLDPTTEHRFIRDAAGKITQYIDEKGNGRSYAYNAKGELTLIIDPLNNEVTLGRNADGDLITKTYSTAGQVLYTYDANRRLVQKLLVAPKSGETSTFMYNAASQVIRRDASITGTDAFAHATSYVYGYDLAGREALIEETAGLPVHYEWDVDGSRTSVSVPGTTYHVLTEYDANHRPVRMVDTWTGDIWYFNHDAANRRTSVVYPDGSAIFTSSDAAGQVVEQRALAATGAVLFLEQNSYDQRGNITQTLTQDERRTYSYNRRDWLTLTVVENLAAGTFYFQQLDYDAAGNLIRQELRAPNQNRLPFSEIFYNSQEGTPELTENIVVTYQYNPADQLVYERGTRDDGSDYEAHYTWDGAGNMAGKRVRDFKGNLVNNTMTWSAENRLLAQTNDNGLVFNNPSLVEKDGREQNTWATDRTWLNNKYVSRTYDHVMRHVLWEGDAANPEARYILGPNRDEMLSASVKMGGGIVRSYTYQNFRQDVLSVQSNSALYSSSRKFLPTGLAITDGQSPGNPGRGRNPPNPNPYSYAPPPPFPFAFQGKEHTVAGTDFGNRLGATRFSSLDPLVLEGVKYEEEYNLLSQNTLTNVDPSGLYTVLATCKGQRFSSPSFDQFNNTSSVFPFEKEHNLWGTHWSSIIYKAMDTQVKPALFYTDCIGNTNNLRSKARKKYSSYVIGCNGTRDYFPGTKTRPCGAWQSGNLATIYPNNLYDSYLNYVGSYFQYGYLDKKKRQYVGYDKMKSCGVGDIETQFAQGLLHELIHVARNSPSRSNTITDTPEECLARTCTFGCSVRNKKNYYIQDEWTKEQVLAYCKNVGGDPHCK